MNRVLQGLIVRIMVYVKVLRFDFTSWIPEPILRLRGLFGVFKYFSVPPLKSTQEDAFMKHISLG